MQNLSDEMLVTLYKEFNDQKYLTTLFERHSNIVYRSALRIMKNTSDTEDIVQTCYCKMITDLHLHNGSGSVLGWMIQVTIRTCYQFKRSEKSRLSREKKRMSERITLFEPKSNELNEMIETHLNNLPEIYKAPIILQIIEGLSVKEVSQILAIPENTIRSQIARGLEKLKKSLQNVGFTASIVTISDSLKVVPMPIAPDTIKTSNFYNTVFKNTAIVSARTVAYTGSGVFLFKKLLGAFFLVSLAIGCVIIWNKNSTISKTKVKELVKVRIKNSKYFSFENKRELEETHLIRGSLVLLKNRGINNSDCIEVKPLSVYELDISEFNLPIKITYSFDCILSSGDKGKGIVIAKGNYRLNQNIFNFTNLQTTKGFNVSNEAKINKNENAKYGYIGEWSSRTIYVSQEGVDVWFNNKRSSVLLGSSIDNKKIYFYVLDQVLLDDLTITTIDSDTVPDLSIFKNYTDTILFEKGGRSYPIDKVKLNLESSSPAKLTIYDKTEIENALGIE